MKSLHFKLAVINICIGVLYAFSDGPYVKSEGEVISSRALLSAGAEGGLIIAIALISFLVSAIAPLVIRMKSAALLAVYAANYFLYGALLLLAKEYLNKSTDSGMGR